MAPSHSCKEKRQKADNEQRDNPATSLFKIRYCALLPLFVILDLYCFAQVFVA